MSFEERVEELLDERNEMLNWDCVKIYFLADLYSWVDEDRKFLYEEKSQYWFLESKREEDFHYDLRSAIFGLSEFLNKKSLGFDKEEVPLIQYHLTKDNKLLITCFVKTDYLKDHKEDCPEKLEKWLNGQISDGWGEDGFFVRDFIGDIREVYAGAVERVVRVASLEELEPHFEAYKKQVGQSA